MIWNMTGYTISAEQKLRTVFDLYGLHVNFNTVFRADSSADNVLAGMSRSLLGSHAAGAHLLLNHRVVLSFTNEFALWCKSVEPRITNMSDGCNVSPEVKRNN